jgi:phospholipid/cholesterol/gamma-HCH transport system substrate-binding protein
MDERRLEIKVGALVVAALAGVFGLLYLMGELSLSSGGALKVDFSHTGNVVKGAPVKLGGVAVGRVEEIRLLPDRRDPAGNPLPVQMALSVTPEALAALRSDVRVTVATVGLLGEPYLELTPGSARAAPLPAEAAVRGTDAPRLDVVALQLSAFLDAASSALAKDPEGLMGLASNVSNLARRLNDMLGQNDEDVRTLVSELSAASKDLRVLAHSARVAMQPGGPGARLIDDAAAVASVAKRDLPGISASAGRTLNGLANVTGGLTPEDGERVRTALASYTAAGAHLQQVAARADRLLARMEAGEGTLGAMQKDPQLYEELKALVTDLRKHPWKVLWKD